MNSIPNLDTLSGLEQTFHDVSSMLEELNLNAVRDKKYDATTLKQNELGNFLKSDISNGQKRATLLTQIGYLRIDLFMEYYERMRIAQVEGNLDQAVKLMNDYAETVTIPFIIQETQTQKSVTKQIAFALRIQKRINYFGFINEWKNSYETWPKRNTAATSNNNQKELLTEFDIVKKKFLTLYTYSFSPENFPPVANRRTDR